MSAEYRRQTGVRAWIRWLLFSEALILLLAVAGPGYRSFFHHRGDHGLLARMVMEDPDFLDAVMVNFVAVHIFVIAIWLLAWLIGRGARKRSGTTRRWSRTAARGGRRQDKWR